MSEQSDNTHEDDTIVSKSQRKRDAQRVLDLAKTLVTLGDKLFKSLTLPEPIREAAVLARSINAHIGRKRQIHYLGKLMRNTDIDGIYTQLQAIEDHAEISRKHHKQLEQWRERLIDEGDNALTELLAQWPHAERQTIRQLVRNTHREQSRQSPPKSARALFQYLKRVSGNTVVDSPTNTT